MGITIGIVGVGNMGLPLARNLIGGGFKVLGYRRGSMDGFLAAGGVPVNSPQELAAECDVVITILPSVEALDEVVSGEKGLVSGAKPGLIVIEMSGMPVEVKERQFDELQPLGVEMLDCPITGMPPMVTDRTAVILGSDDKETFDRCTSVFDSITDATHYLGAFGMGSKMKFVSHTLVAIHNMAAAEAMALSEKAGFNPQQVVEVISNSAASSKAFKTRAPMMTAREFLPPQAPVSLLQEAVQQTIHFAEEIGSPTPLLSVVASYCERAVEGGMAEQDTAALFSVLAGEEIPTSPQR